MYSSRDTGPYHPSGIAKAAAGDPRFPLEFISYVSGAIASRPPPELISPATRLNGTHLLIAQDAFENKMKKTAVHLLTDRLVGKKGTES